MRPKLLQNFFVVLTFWFIATTLWWSFQKPQVNLDALQAIQSLMPFLNISVPAEAGIMGSLGVQMKVLVYWTVPLLVGTALSAALGYGWVWWRARGEHQARAKREAGTGEFRGVTLTVGELPVPTVLPKDDIELSAEPGSPLEKMSDQERKLLEDVLGTLSAHPDTYAGPDVSGPLVEHAMALAEKALDQPRNASLLALVAASSELGKITAYRKDKNGEWVMAKNVDRESARILGVMPSWFALPYEARNAIMSAVKYRGNARAMPEFESNEAVYRLARALLSQREETHQQVVEVAQQRTLERAAESLPGTVLSAFLQGLPSMSFQTRSLPKGVRATAWKVGSRVYMLEIALRESVLPKLGQELRSALTTPPGAKPRLHPFTVELLKSLHSKGWLVCEHESQKVDPKEALWNVKAGKLEFKGVIVIELPDEYKDQLPPGDSIYEVSITGPLFQHNAPSNTSQSVTKEDLLGSVLRAAPDK